MNMKSSVDEGFNDDTGAYIKVFLRGMIRDLFFERVINTSKARARKAGKKLHKAILLNL